MRVSCDVDEIDMDGDHGTVPGVCITCRRCDHEAEVYGTSPRSVRRGLVTLREECPMGEENFYDAGEAGEGD